MTHSIHLEPTARRESMYTALAHVSALEIALVFPLGATCALAEPAELEALRERCDALGVRAIIIGGDETLRARAVAAGFAAATTMEEWDTSSHKAVHPSQRSWGPRVGRRSNAGLPSAGMRMLGDKRSHDEEDVGDLYEPIGEDPPGYVADLIAGDQELSPPRRHAEVPTVPLRRGRATRKLADSLRELARERDALERAHQAYEEQITATIRTSAGMDDATAQDLAAPDEPLEADGS